MTTSAPFLTRCFVILLGSIVLVVGATPAPADGARIRRTDPRGDATVDVWSTSKATVHRTRHRVWFRVHGSLFADWTVDVFVDSRGGRTPDYRLWNFENLGESGCGGKLVSGQRIDLRCGRRIIECCVIATLWWSIPRKELRPDKLIRWRVRTEYPGGQPDDAPVPAGDRAPDDGWYP